MQSLKKIWDMSKYISFVFHHKSANAVAKIEPIEEEGAEQDVGNKIERKPKRKKKADSDTDYNSDSDYDDDDSN